MKEATQNTYEGYENIFKDGIVEMKEEITSLEEAIGKINLMNTPSETPHDIVQDQLDKKVFDLAVGEITSIKSKVSCLRRLLWIIITDRTYDPCDPVPDF